MAMAKRLVALMALAALAGVPMAAACDESSPTETTPTATSEASPSPTPTRAPEATPTPRPALTYQVTYVYAQPAKIGTQVWVERPPLRASWVFLDNGYMSGWIYDGTTVTSCSGVTGGAGECTLSQQATGTPPAGIGGGATATATPPGLTQLPSRTIAGREASCWQLPQQSGAPADYCVSHDGIMLYTSSAGITLEAIEVRDTVDESLLSPPYPVKR